MTDSISIVDETNDTSPHIDSEDKKFEKKLLRKIDLRLLVITNIMYILACLDRINIGNARIAGLEKDLGLIGNQYQIALSIYFLGG
ncbi:16879_t:CDS:2, partial [Acaulospora morrowiae]